LLLNTALTVRAHDVRTLKLILRADEVADCQAGSHSNKGWETFTAAVLRVVTERLSPSESADHVPGAKGVVFMAWGAHAQKMCAGVDKVRAAVSLAQAFVCQLARVESA
jgi:uracil-DNA glycosylase